MTYKMDSYKNRVPMLQFPIRLDLGAGQYPQPGMVRLDFDPLGTDIVWDVKDGIPLPDCSVSELYTSHFLEHLAPTDYHYVLQEMFRVCTHMARVTIKLPYGDLPEGALPCHYNRFKEADMEAINIWFPHHMGTYWDLKSVSRDGIHLVGEFVIVKPAAA
jgi:predicted SAM-dependent methyltransferase